MDTLSQIFGSALRVKMMRLFLFNAETAFDMDQIIVKTGAKNREIEKEISFLKKLGLIKNSKVVKIITTKNKAKITHKKKKVKAWTLDTKFIFISALTDFLVRTHSLEHKAIVKRLEKAGRIKAILVSGIFTQNLESRLDMFVVGDNIKSASMDRIVRSIESDMGKDIRYTVLSAPDFSYRVSMNDKLVRDVLDFPHKVLVDKIGLPTV